MRVCAALLASGLILIGCSPEDGALLGVDGSAMSAGTLLRSIPNPDPDPDDWFGGIPISGAFALRSQTRSGFAGWIASISILTILVRRRRNHFRDRAGDRSSPSFTGDFVRATSLFAFVAALVSPGLATADSVGRVEDAFTHEPVANAEVVVLSGTKEASKARTAADGSFTVPGNPRAANRLRVRADGFAESIVDFTEQNVTVLLYAGVPISGVVLADGKPVAYAAVACRPGVLRETAPVFTDSAGRFHIACPAGHVHLVARAAGKGAVVEHLALRVEGESKQVTMSLRAPIVLEGRVLDNGKPVAGVDVMAYPNDEYLSDMPTVGAVTDVTGRFKTEAVGEGIWKLAAYSNYRVGVATNIPAIGTAKPAPVDITLEPALPIDIQVTADGAPVSQTPVRMNCNVPEKRASVLSGFHHRLLVERGVQDRWTEWDETTDRSGIAHFSTRMKGSCWVAVNSAAGRGGMSVTTEMKDATLTLLPAATLGTIRGRVVITGEAYSGERSASAIASEPKSPTNYVFSGVDADGTFEIANVAPGHYSVDVLDQKLTGPTVGVKVVAGKSVEAPEITLERQSDAFGRVVDAVTKKPLSRVTYVVEYRIGTGAGAAGNFPPRITDAEGRFKVEGIRGKLTIVLFRAGFRPRVFTLDAPMGGEIDLGNIEMTAANDAVPTVLLQTAKGVVGDGIAREVAENVVRKKVVELDACYQQALVEDPTLSGSVIVEFRVLPGGYALDTRVKESTMTSPALDNCLWNRVRGAEFGKTQNGAEVVVEFPFEFTLSH